jgi:hypothetical protein
MPLNKHHFKNLIIRTLTELRLNSESAVNLLMGTAAQESEFGSYLVQLNGGPAKGAFQVEPATFDWIYEHFYHQFPILIGIEFEDLEWNLKFGIILCRLKYLSIKEPLPKPEDIRGMARYWKLYYNSPAGAGTETEFVLNYKKYVI